MANIFDTIRPDPTAGYQWYQRQVKKLTNVRGQTERLLTQSNQLTTNLYPGKMYLFFYDAKHKDTLPYWDKFPLVLPFRKVPTGFYGLNLHYIPYMLRFKILGILSDYVTDTRNDENTRIRLSWRTLSSAARLAPLKACVKQYLYSQVESKFLTIAYPDWVTASQLPVENFVGASKTQVWRDSQRKV